MDADGDVVNARLVLVVEKVVECQPGNAERKIKHARLREFVEVYAEPSASKDSSETTDNVTRSGHETPGGCAARAKDRRRA